MKTLLLVLSILLVLSCTPNYDTTAQDNPAYTFVKLAGTDTLQRPVYLTHAGDERLFVVEQPGRIRIIQDGVLLQAPFLDITDLVDDSANERGFLSIAFDPAYADTGRFYANYTAEPDGRTVIARYRVSADDPNRADPTSAEVILEIAQPYPNHNGGQLQFGPDGFLYIGMGDGGSGGDPENHAQRLNSLLGKILRLDVSPAVGYAIPADNPFLDTPDALPEIWAYGLRNPWRFSFDRATGDLFIGDVGQNAFEEIDFQPAGSSGGENYGWRFFEGDTAYRNPPNDRSPFIFPVYTYNHNQGCSVTGGYVYRGDALPNLQGLYFFADYCAGQVWTLQPATWEQAHFRSLDARISSFGEDLHGELYLTTFSDVGVWKLVAG
jgi:glucose/arabinose dehydrogenase